MNVLLLLTTAIKAQIALTLMELTFVLLMALKTQLFAKVNGINIITSKRTKFQLKRYSIIFLFGLSIGTFNYQLLHILHHALSF